MFRLILVVLEGEFLVGARRVTSRDFLRFFLAFRAVTLIERVRIEPRLAARNRALEFQPLRPDLTEFLEFVRPRRCPRRTRTATVTANRDHPICLATQQDDQNTGGR